MAIYVTLYVDIVIDRKSPLLGAAFFVSRETFDPIWYNIKNEIVDTRGKESASL